MDLHLRRACACIDWNHNDLVLISSDLIIQLAVHQLTHFYCCHTGDNVFIWFMDNRATLPGRFTFLWDLANPAPLTMPFDVLCYMSKRHFTTGENLGEKDSFTNRDDEAKPTVSLTSELFLGFYDQDVFFFLHPMTEGILMHVLSVTHTYPNVDNNSKDGWNCSILNTCNNNKRGCHFLLTLASCFIPHVY